MKQKKFVSTNNFKITKNSKLCIGSVIFLENVEPSGAKSNFVYRVGLMCKHLDIEDLRKDSRVFESVDEFLNS
jgi:hypothetical protein